MTATCQPFYFRKSKSVSETAAMAGPDDIFNFMAKFCNLWNAGKNARLLAECKAGEASINLHLQLGHYPVAPQAMEHPRQPGPSRLRRRARRAQARAAAAASALVRCDAAVQAVIPLPRIADTAVQTL